MNDKNFDNDDDFDELDEDFEDDIIYECVDGDNHIYLEDVVNEEQILTLALRMLEFDENNDIAEKIVTWYAINSLVDSGMQTFTADDVSEKYNEIIIGYTLKSMVDDGEIQANFDDDGEIRYTLTELGNQLSLEDKVEEKE